jgi:RNA polymerase sigma-70 factor, ECF subfamily
MGLDRDRLLRLLLAHRAMLVGYITAIVVVLKKGHQLDDEAGFPAWVRKVARLEALSGLRQRKHTRQFLDESALDLLEDQWSASDGTPLAAATEALRECTKKLGPHARRLIEMRYVHNVRGKDLAEKLGQPPNTVYVALSRVYRALSTCVKGRLAAEGVAYG